LIKPSRDSRLRSAKFDKCIEKTDKRKDWLAISLGSFSVVLRRNLNSGITQSHAQYEQKSGFPMSMEADLVSGLAMNLELDLVSGLAMNILDKVNQ